MPDVVLEAALTAEGAAEETALVEDAPLVALEAAPRPKNEVALLPPPPGVELTALLLPPVTDEAVPASDM